MPVARACVLAAMLASCASGSRVAERDQHRGPAFVCDGPRCQQRYPRVPDDGQWECIDLDGAVVCRGGAPSAGVVPGDADRGWICGARRGTPERICIDFAPDLPPGERRGWRCLSEHSGGERRLCVRDPLAPQVRIPARVHPDCWLDQDCSPGETCLQGSCGTSG